MRYGTRLLLLAGLAAGFSSTAGAADYSNAASYNSPYGMSAGQENQTINPSLRDSNGNLTVINGQFTSSAFSQQTGAQAMGTTSAGVQSGAGMSSGVAYGSATAIGNALNVVTVGNNNTVVVNASQTNTGDITATTSLNGSTH
jgi:holdfast attachment protein HfaA